VTHPGPLSGLRVLEIESIGPVPWAGMMLSDWGADVLRVDRPDPPDMGEPRDVRHEVTQRGRRSLVVDLKRPEGVQEVLQLVARADLLLEGMRPGVMERLGLGPEVCLACNPRLVYGRMTGWGQDGPLAKAAGHDLNYIALSGALHAIGRQGGGPEIPLNLIGDFGGGSMYLTFGILCALFEARGSGQGQVVDAAMIDGSTSLMSMIYGAFAAGYWKDERGSNRLDSGAPWYEVYETSDGKWVAVGSTEHTFYVNTLRVLGLDAADFGDQHDRAAWPAIKDAMRRAFKARTRDQWVEMFEGTETCFSPVLSLAEAPQDPHQRARGNFVEVAGVLQPAPTPRFSRSRGAIRRAPPEVGEHTDEVLRECGFSAEEIVLMRQEGGI